MEKPLEERIKFWNNNDFKYMYAAYMLASKVDGATFLDGFRFLNWEMAEADLTCLREHGACFFNPAGGRTYDVEYKEFCRRKEIVFPNFSEKDIRIKQFKGGTHYYAFIGNVQVRDGDIMKFDSYEKAYGKAYRLVTDGDKE